MASLYKRPDSAYWWVSFLDMVGKRKCKSTGLRWREGEETRKARQLCRELGQQEQSGPDFGKAEMWEAWAPRLLEQRYAGQPKSLARYRICWAALSAWLGEEKIFIPRQLNRQHVRAYIAFRAVPRPDLGLRAVQKNTALLEIKLLGLLMREAVQSGFATVNPCDHLGIGRDAPRKKPRITDDEHRRILEALRDEPEWMHLSYLIAWEQGCRISETCVKLSDVHLGRSTIAFHTKGHKGSVAEFPLSDKLVPLLTKLKREGREFAFKFPRFPNKAWFYFFRRIGLPHLCFHCVRVTFITRCYEQGIPKEQVMRLVGHASSTVHEVYPRLTADHQTVQALRKLL